MRSGCFSQNHQIFSDDDLALEILLRRGAPGFVADGIDGRDQMRQYEGLDPGLLRDTADILDRRVVGLHVRDEIFKRDRSAFGDLAADMASNPGTYIASCTRTSPPASDGAV